MGEEGSQRICGCHSSMSIDSKKGLAWVHCNLSSLSTSSTTITHAEKHRVSQLSVSWWSTLHFSYSLFVFRQQRMVPKSISSYCVEVRHINTFNILECPHKLVRMHLFITLATNPPRTTEKNFESLIEQWG
jgi:hypothetical protein